MNILKHPVWNLRWGKPYMLVYPIPATCMLYLVHWCVACMGWCKLQTAYQTFLAYAHIHAHTHTRTQANSGTSKWSRNPIRVQYRLKKNRGDRTCMPSQLPLMMVRTRAALWQNSMTAGGTPPNIHATMLETAKEDQARSSVTTLWSKDATLITKLAGPSNTSSSTLSLRTIVACS